MSVHCLQVMSYLFLPSAATATFSAPDTRLLGASCFRSDTQRPRLSTFRAAEFLLVPAHPFPAKQNNCFTASWPLKILYRRNAVLKLFWVKSIQDKLHGGVGQLVMDPTACCAWLAFQIYALRVCLWVGMYILVCMDGWMDGWMHACMDGWMDGWMDGCVYVCMCMRVRVYVCMCLRVYVCMYSCMHAWMDGCREGGGLDGWTGGWMFIHINIHMCMLCTCHSNLSSSFWHRSLPYLRTHACCLKAEKTLVAKRTCGSASNRGWVILCGDAGLRQILCIQTCQHVTSGRHCLCRVLTSKFLTTPLVAKQRQRVQKLHKPLSTVPSAQRGSERRSMPAECTICA